MNKLVAVKMQFDDGRSPDQYYLLNLIKSESCDAVELIKNNEKLNILLQNGESGIRKYEIVVLCENVSKEIIDFKMMKLKEILQDRVICDLVDSRRFYSNLLGRVVLYANRDVDDNMSNVRANCYLDYFEVAL